MVEGYFFKTLSFLHFDESWFPYQLKFSRNCSADKWFGKGNRISFRWLSYRIFDSAENQLSYFLSFPLIKVLKSFSANWMNLGLTNFPKGWISNKARFPISREIGDKLGSTQPLPNPNKYSPTKVVKRKKGNEKNPGESSPQNLKKVKTWGHTSMLPMHVNVIKLEQVCVITTKWGGRQTSWPVSNVGFVGVQVAFPIKFDNILRLEQKPKKW